MLPGNEIAAWCTLGLACLIIGESALESTAPFSFDKQMDTTLNHGDDRRLGSQTMFRDLFFALSPRFRAKKRSLGVKQQGARNILRNHCP